MPTQKLYKATRPNGTDFHSGTINYAAALEAKSTIQHPNPGAVGDEDAAGYISVTDSPLDIPGASWPLRLFEVRPVGKSWKTNSYAHKHAAHAVKVIREVSPNLVYGPEGERVAEIATAFWALPLAERDRMYYGRPTGFVEAWRRARSAAASLGVWSNPAGFVHGLVVVGWGAGLGGALALLVRGLDPSKITDEDYETLSAPWRSHQGPVSAKDNLPAKGFTPTEVKK